MIPSSCNSALVFTPLRRLIFILGLWLGLGQEPAQAQFVGCPAIQQVSRVECEALIKLYDQANGVNWFDNRGWALSNQPCNWFGITCNVSPWPRKITGIRLLNNNVGGPIPGELGFLTELRELTIDNSTAGLTLSKLFGTIPSGLGDLENLEILRLGTNALGGGIPPELSRLKNLRVLDLRDNILKNNIPFELGALKKLERLNLSQNRLERSIPAALGQLDSLRFLDLSSNLLTGEIPESLGDLGLLESLNVSNNQLVGRLPLTLAQLSNLFRLALSDNRLSGIVPPKLARLGAEIVNCSLESNDASLCIPGSGPYVSLGKTEICGLPLDASCRTCAPADTVCMALEAVYTQTGGLDWSTDANWLTTSDWCTWSGVTCVAGDLKRLALPENNLSGPLPEALSALASLTTIDWSGNALTGPLPVSWSGLTQLSEVDLSENQLTGALPLALAEVFSGANLCNLTGNATGLCVPDTPPFRAFGQTTLCGLPLESSCTVASEVAFVRFEARVTQGQVVLSWTASGELDAGFFEVQRKQENAFVTIGTVEGTSSAEYTFTTSPDGRGPQTYQIAWISASGVKIRSAEVTVEVSVGGWILSVPYPHPVTETSAVRMAAAEDATVRLHMYDVLGREVRTLFEGPLTGGTPRTLNLTTHGLPGGWYLIQMETAEGVQARQAVLVIH